MLPRLKNNVPAVAGVYQIINTITGESYVGSSKDIRWRWKDHRNKLRNNAHTERLTIAVEKYGWEAFDIQIIEEVTGDKKLRLQREQYWIDNIRPEYNGSPSSDSNKGAIFLERARRNQSEGKKGIVFSEQHIANLVAFQNNPEIKKATSEKFSKLWSDPETRPIMEAARAKGAETFTGHKITPEQSKAQSERQTGRIHKPETKNQMSQSHLERWENIPEEERIARAKKSWETRRANVAKKLELVDASSN